MCFCNFFLFIFIFFCFRFLLVLANRCPSKCKSGAVSEISYVFVVEMACSELARLKREMDSLSYATRADSGKTLSDNRNKIARLRANIRNMEAEIHAIDDENRRIERRMAENRANLERARAQVDYHPQSCKQCKNLLY